MKWIGRFGYKIDWSRDGLWNTRDGDSFPVYHYASVCSATDGLNSILHVFIGRLLLRFAYAH